MGVVDQVVVTMMIINSDDEDDNGVNDDDENVGDGDPCTGLKEVDQFTSFLNYQSVRGNFPRC